MRGAVEQIKSKLNIVDVVGTYVKLEKAGGNLKACCPFHQEKTPSFFVSPARDSYHCFGCNRGGDVISFVEEIEGLDFMGALKVLADRAGVVIDQVSVKRDPERDRLFAINEAAREYYAGELKNAEPVKKYLTERGVTGESIKDFAIGWAPATWQGLYDHLTGLGFRLEDIEKAGLIIKSTKAGSRSQWYDRFRSRIMFPLADSSGRTVGFSGRIFGSADDGTSAKYVNSPETPVYQKSRVLYGLHRAKLALKQEDLCVLVEGQFDLVMSHQVGVANAVAVSGTALTRDHLELIGRFTKNIVMAFDGDSAGLKAARRAIELGLEIGMEMRVAELPEGEDPASVCQKNPERWRQAVKSAKHVIDFLLLAISKRSGDERARAHAIKEEVYPYIARLQQRIDQAYFINKVIDLTGLREDVIRADLNEQRYASPVLAKPEPAKSRSRLDLIEEKLAHPEFLVEGEAEALNKEKEIELLLKQRFEATEELNRASRTGDASGEQQYLKTINELSRKINELKK